MKSEELSRLLYSIKDTEPVVVLNENAPIKAAVNIKNAFIMTDADGGKKLVLTYDSKEREGK